ncbi:uncharacterized protein LTR77_006716 [Saxophila tyrrhenica]|uniref:Peptidase A1 domain-containing protein n=1 Tax=Saxophila tyrrhenica TaxID=1690608 RepID=A0AAV9P8I4_9PEZI|nr:hypothetical protein LTR77_006716 [Saxophila tyrrhenica]
MPSLLDQMRLLPAALLALTFSYAVAAQNDGSGSTPRPIAIPPSQQWDGIDGSWSSFAIQVGTPRQDIRTFVSWNAYQTWAVIPEGCEAADDYDACAQARGGIFNQTASRSWDEQGLYELRILQNLGYDGNGYYGFDVLELGGAVPIVRNTTVAGFALDDFYLGVLGINPKPTNFSEDTTGAPSYMTLLKDQEHIPSISFGYTAGAHYRDDNTSNPYCSLTLGGYDKTKFFANDLTWNFAADNSRDIVVALQDDSSPVATELLPNAISVYLDATVPQIWLPLESCYVFEYEFGLVYDNATELYLVNNTLHRQLVSRNASITFQLAVDNKGGDVVNIELPYAAFDLTAKSPYQELSDDTYYFPLRRASGESQYTLGRVFFQEAYIAIDYESQKFNVSQRAWDGSSDQNLVTIPAYSMRSDESSYPGVGSPDDSSSSSGLSGGVIAGIVIGVIALVVILVLLAIWLRRRRSKAAKQRALENEKLGSASDTASDHDTSSPGRGTESVVIPKAELPGSEPPAQSESESGGEQNPFVSGALSDGSSSPSDTRSPRTPNALSGHTFVSGRWNNEAYSPSTDGPEEGTGTHSSTDSSSRGTGTASRVSHYGTGTGTLASLVSPLSPVDSHEADGKERHVFEMAGDMPTVKEKDGHEMSEKEAMAHREKVYNGVENPPSPSEVAAMSHEATGREAPSKVDAGDVVRASGAGLGTGEGGKEERDFGLHRQFSFEGEAGRREAEAEAERTEELYK